MNNIDQIPLVRLRPDKFDDIAVKEHISLIQQACEDADPDTIALVFHECDYNMQNTIARIKAGDFQDGEWQTAKSTNKKKVSNHNNHHTAADQIVNGGILSDSERSGSQRTSPTSSLRGGHRRNDRYGYSSSSSRTNGRRRGTEPGRNQFNSRASTRTNPMQRSIASNPSEISYQPQQSIEDIPQMTSSLVDEYEFTDDRTQTLTFDNSQKTVPIRSASKHPVPSTIPRVPVAMHSTVRFSSQPVDIQFGDIQWQNSVPIVVIPSRESPTGSDNEEEELVSMVSTKNQDIHPTLSSNFSITRHQPTNDTDNQLLETTASLSLTNVPMVSPENTSHLSDHLTNLLPVNPNQSSSQTQESVQIPINRLPPTSTPRPSEYTSPTSQSIPKNNHQQLQPSNSTNATTSAFTPVDRLNTYPNTANWNSQPVSYKSMSKATMIPAGAYPQSSYTLSSQQQQQQPIFFQHYPYPSLSPTVVQVYAPVEHWSSNGFPTPLESYPYPHPNYMAAYNNPRHYHPPPKYDQPIYDKEFFAHYGQQPRPSNADPSYQQQTSTSSQPAQDPPVSTSKLSPTAPTFSQGTPLTNSPSATTFYLNAMSVPMPNYYSSITGTAAHPDRTYSYSSIDNRDNRNGANNRSNYYHYGQQQQQQQQQQQARTHNNNVSNSTWHGQS